RAASYPAADGVLTFDKLSSVFLSGNRTRDDQPDHIRIANPVPAELASMWARMCPAQVYEPGPAGADGLVRVEVSPSNCVQCGAITAKGGRLTPPEGGSGPEYTLTWLPDALRASRSRSGTAHGRERGPGRASCRAFAQPLRSTPRWALRLFYARRTGG